MVSNPKIRKITFTGSTEVGKQLIRGSADHVKRVSMELGGHAPFLVFEDADIQLAVDSCIKSKFRNAGQTCICANRIYVHESIMDQFSTQLADRVQKLKLGDGLQPDTEIGPLINEDTLQRMNKQVEDAVSKGARVVTGGKEWNSPSLAGAFYEPTVISHVDDSMIISHEETFGPIAPLISFKTDEEAIKLANNSRYGLAAYAFTKDLSRSMRVAERLEYGIIGMNDPLPTVPQAPFGGMKESGLGREGGYYGVDEFLEVKYISFALDREE